MARTRVVDGDCARGKVAGSPSRGRHALNRAAGLGRHAGSLVIREEVDPLMPNWSAHCTSKLILMKRCTGQTCAVGEKIVCIECLVADKLERRAVILVGSSLDRS